MKETKSRQDGGLSGGEVVMWQSLDNYRKLLFLSDSVFLLVPISFHQEMYL